MADLLPKAPRAGVLAVKLQQTPLAAATSVLFCSAATHRAMQHLQAQDVDLQADTGPRTSGMTGLANPKAQQQEPATAAAAATDTEEEEEDEQEEEAAKDRWQQMLWDALSTAAPPASFACSGQLDQQQSLTASSYPEVTVAGVGRLGLPLSAEQAATLKAVAEQAPHGKGLRMVVDTAVRDAHQVDASQVSIGDSWAPVQQAAVAKLSNILGLGDSAAGGASVEARLYKLLLYEAGGHFAAHQDTEKERGMIGTLVVQLPCAQGHTGGRLTMRHKGKSHTVDFEQESGRSLQFAAFFADCEHELSLISSGRRLVLVYNLVWVGSGSAPALLTKSPTQQRLGRALRAWEADLAAGGRRKRIAFLLEHKYTQANLRFNHLKGNDTAMADALATCPGLDVHLVLVTRTVTTDAADDDYGGYGKDFEDVAETSQWVSRDVTYINYGSINPRCDFWHPKGAPLFGPSDYPDEEKEQYTGNEGTTRDQNYRRVLLVLWPSSQAVANSAQAGFYALQCLLKVRMQDVVALQHSFDSHHAQHPQQHQQPDTAAVDDTSDQQRPQQQHHHQQQQEAQGDTAAAAAKVTRKLKQAHKDLLAVLEACVQHLQAGLERSGQGYYYDAQHTLQDFTAVLQQGTRAVQLGVEGAGQVLLRLVLAAAASPRDLLADAVTAAAMGAAAAAVEAEEAAPLLQQLVSRSVAAHPGSCIALISSMSGQPGLQLQPASAAADAMAATPAQ